MKSFLLNGFANDVVAPRAGMTEVGALAWHEVGTKAASSDTGFCSNGKI